MIDYRKYSKIRANRLRDDGDYVGENAILSLLESEMRLQSKIDMFYLIVNEILNSSLSEEDFKIKMKKAEKILSKC